MPRLQTQARTETARTPAFHYRSEQRALEERVRRMMQSIAETTASLPAEPSEFAPYKPLSVPTPRWRANWVFIGGLLFTLLAWWVILTSAATAVHAVFHHIPA
jgi:hypothetical protein